MANTSILAALARYAGLYTSTGTPDDTPVQRDLSTAAARQANEQNFDQSNQVSDPDLWSAYNASMTRPASYTAMLQLWDQMANWDLLAAALVEVVEEAIQAAPTDPGVLWYKCSDSKVEAEVNKMLADVEASQLIPSQVWHVAGYGNAFEKVDYSVGEGVQGLSYAHPMDVKRLWLSRNRKCVGFRWNGHKPDQSVLQDENGNALPRVSLSGDSGALEDLYYPWDFIHFRRLCKMRLSEHGEPIFSDAQGIYKKLRLAVDQMVVYRAQIQPDRYAVNIDVQEQAPAQQAKTVQHWKQMLRKKLAFGVGDGQGGDSDFASFNNPMALDTILWLAQPKGFQHTVTKLAGTTAVPDVYDVEMLINLFFAVIGMPRWWIMGQQGNENPASGKSLMATDMRFLRKIKALRQPIRHGYEQLAYLHLVLKDHAKYDVTELDISAQMSEIGTLDDQIKVDILTAQADALDKMSDVMEKLRIPPESWVDLIFKDYLRLPDDVISMIVTNLPPEIEPKGESEGPRLSRAQIMEELMRAHGRDMAELKTKMTRILSGVQMPEGFSADRLRRKHLAESLLKVPEILDTDAVASGWGTHPVRTCAPVKAESLTEGVDTAKAVLGWSSDFGFVKAVKAEARPNPVAESSASAIREYI